MVNKIFLAKGLTENQAGLTRSLTAAPVSGAAYFGPGGLMGIDLTGPLEG